MTITLLPEQIPLLVQTRYDCPTCDHWQKTLSDIPLPRGVKCWACGGEPMVKEESE